MRCINCSSPLPVAGAYCPACGCNVRVIPLIPPMGPHVRPPIPAAGWLWTAALTLGALLALAGLFYQLPLVLCVGLALLVVTALITLVGSLF